MTDIQRRILQAIAELPQAYGNSIVRHINRDIPDNWLTRRWPSLRELRLGSFHVHVMRMEKDGLVWSEWSAETYPDRGNRRRRYYHLTPAGTDLLKSQSVP